MGLNVDPESNQIKPNKVIFPIHLSVKFEIHSYNINLTLMLQLSRIRIRNWPSDLFIFGLDVGKKEVNVRSLDLC